MPVRSANAEGQGDTPWGRGTLRSQTGAIDGQYSFSSRFEEGTGGGVGITVPGGHAASRGSGLFSFRSRRGSRAEAHDERGAPP